MGLDMYLDKAKRVGDVTAKDLGAIESYFSYVTRPEKHRHCTAREWSGLDLENVKFDLTKHYISEYRTHFDDWDTEEKYGFSTIFTKVGYWRKANAIHKWFVENVQNGVDDCGLYEVTKEQLRELLELCLVVLRESKLVTKDDNEYIEDPSLSKELLPTVSGFFFGGTEYDGWYYRDLENTVQILTKAINETDFENEMIVYQSSW